MRKITLILFALFMNWQINAQTIVIGTATTTTDQFGITPIHGYYKNFRYQVIYTAAELSASLTPYDEITALGFSISGDYGTDNNLAGYTIKMGHTTAANCANHIASPTFVVKNPFAYNPTVTAAGEFDMIAFDTNFIWNGIDNVVIDICTNGPNLFTSPYGQIRGSTTATNASRFNRSDADLGTACSTVTTSTANVKPNIQFTYVEGTPPSCLAPGGFVASNFTSNSATISWNASSSAPSEGYEYYSSLVNTAPVAGGEITTGLTASLSGLEAASTYYVWLRSNCGSGDFSSWSGPYTFVTNCGTVSAINQGFENTTGQQFPICWAKVGTTGNAYTQASTAITGARNLYMYTSTATSKAVVSLVPVNNAGAGTHRMVMKVRANFTVGEKLELGYLTNPTNAASFIVLNSIIINSTTVFQNFISVPTGLPAGNTVFALRASGTVLASILVDDVAWEPIPLSAPNCSEIVSPINNAINVSSGKISWATNIDASEYVISAGITPGGTSIANMLSIGNVTSYTFPTNPGTTYYVKLFPKNANGTATGCAEIAFTTCDSFSTFPFVETFETSSTSKSCWTVLDVNADGDKWNLSTATTTMGGALAASINTDGNAGANDDYLISPNLILTGNERLKFSYRGNSTSASEISDFEVRLSTTGIAPADFTTVLMPLTAIPTGNVVQSKTISLTAYTGNVHVAFRVPPAGLDGWILYIDDVIVELSPTVAPGCAEDVAVTRNEDCGNFPTIFLWPAVPGADGYKVYIGTSYNNNVLEGLVVDGVDIGNTLNYSFVGNLSTMYFYEIRAYAGDLVSTDCYAFSFTTTDIGCYCPAVPSSVDNEGITNVKVGSTNFPITLTEPVAKYSNLTASPAANITKGTNTIMTVTLETQFSYFTDVWIDFNNNYTFELSERVHKGIESGNTNPTVMQISFFTPLTASLGTHRMRIISTDNEVNPSNPCYSGSYGAVVDLMVNVLEAPNCLPPSASTTSDLGATSVVLNWVSSGTLFNVEYGPAGFTQGSTAGMIVTPQVTTNTTTLIGLAPQSSYEYYIQTDCGSGSLSPWAGPFSFTTTCAAVNTFPWTEGFENITPGFEVFPSCWFEQNGDYSTSNDIFENNPRSGANYLRISWNALNEYMWTPGFTLTAGVSYDFSFYIQGDGYTGWNVDVFQNISQISTNATQLGGTTTASGAGASSVQPYAKIKNTIVPTTTGVYYFAVRVNQPSSAPNYLAFDDFRMEPTPSCVAPLAPTATNITANSATLNWIATTPAPANGYDYYRTSAGTTPNATTTPTGTVGVGITTANLVSLQSSTIYRTYVRSICGAGDSSSWSDAGQFSTPCAAFNTPFLQNFSTFLPLCWKTAAGGTVSTGPVGSAAGIWTAGGFLNSGTSGAVKVNLYSNTFSSNKIGWLITPEISTTIGAAYTLSLNYGATEWNLTTPTAMGSDDFVKIVMSTDLGVTWTEIHTFNAASNVTNVSQAYTYTVTATASQVKFAFIASDGSVIDAVDYDFFIDNIAFDSALSNVDFDNRSFTAYPNPVKDVLNLSYTQNISQVAVYNLLGQQVLIMNMNANKGQVDMSSLASGTYLVKVNTENAVKTIKVIKQ